MYFGKTDSPLNFNPADLKQVKETAFQNSDGAGFNAFVGCAGWDRRKLRDFYPKAIKNDLTYYSTQFNSVELDETHKQLPAPKKFEEWRDETAAGFKFFARIGRDIADWAKLENVDKMVFSFLKNAHYLEDKLAMVFLQLHHTFAPNAKHFQRVKSFIHNWDYEEVPLAIEFRHTDWLNKPDIADELCAAMRENSVTNVLLDTAGRRDLLHMRLTTATAFIRFVGCNHAVDYSRLDDWVDRISKWKEMGLRNLCFFIHEHKPEKTVKMARHFIEKLNANAGTDLTVPLEMNPETQLELR